MTEDILLSEFLGENPLPPRMEGKERGETHAE
jgi:hypothetical protein